VEVPWPGGPTIGDPSKRPASTPAGTARELGRLEEKLGALGGAGGFDLASLVEAIRDLLPGPPGYTFSGGVYTLEPVCETDSDGKPLPARVVEWGGGDGEIVEVNRKLDALAELFQVHKELRQPVCRGGLITSQRRGRPVTVTFEEAEE
jgi:hypothetical protein